MDLWSNKSEKHNK